MRAKGQLPHTTSTSRDKILRDAKQAKSVKCAQSAWPSSNSTWICSALLSQCYSIFTCFITSGYSDAQARHRKQRWTSVHVIMKYDWIYIVNRLGMYALRAYTHEVDIPSPQRKQKIIRRLGVQLRTVPSLPPLLGTSDTNLGLPPFPPIALDLRRKAERWALSSDINQRHGELIIVHEQLRAHRTLGAVPRVSDDFDGFDGARDDSVSISKAGGANGGGGG